MHRHHALLYSLMIFGGLPLSALANPGSAPLPPDSFINQHVASLSQMSQQVTLDPVVRRRLARHFHTSGPAVVRYIQHNLVLKRTRTAQRYQVYCISRTGREYTINSRLPIGTPVFVMRSTGKPILKLACGNPMVAELPPVTTKISPYMSPELAVLPKPVPAAIPPKLAPNGPVLVAVNSGPGVYVMSQTPVVKVSPFPPTLRVQSGAFPIGLLAGIPIIVAIASHGGSHGGSNNTGTGTTGTNTGTTGTNTGTNTGPGPGPVPEPSTPAAFMVGAAGLLYLLIGARRRSRKVKG